MTGSYSSATHVSLLPPPYTPHTKPASLRGLPSAQYAAHANEPVFADGSVTVVFGAESPPALPLAPKPGQPAPPTLAPKPSQASSSSNSAPSAAAAAATATAPALPTAPKPVPPPAPVVAAAVAPAAAAPPRPKPKVMPNTRRASETMHPIEQGVAQRPLDIEMSDASTYAAIQPKGGAEEQLYSAVKRDEKGDVLYVSVDV